MGVGVHVDLGWRMEIYFKDLEKKKGSLAPPPVRNDVPLPLHAMILLSIRVFGCVE